MSLAAERVADAPRVGVKRLWAPADDVALGRVVLPPAEQTPTTSRVAVLRAAFGESDPRVPSAAVAAEFAFDHAGGTVALMPLGRGAIEWRGELIAADGGRVPLVGQGDDARSGDATDRRAGPLRVVVGERIGTQAPLGLDEPSRRFDLELPAGRWVVRLLAPRAFESQGVALIVADACPDRVTVHLGTRVAHAREPVTLVVRGVEPGSLVADGPAALASGPVREVRIDRASVEDALGRVHPVSLVAPRAGRADEAWRISSPPLPAGQSIWRIEARVRGADGFWRARTLDYLVRTADGPAVADAALARVREHGNGWVDVSIPLAGARVGETVFAAAELWSVAGEDARDATCLGWVGGLAEIGTDGFVELGCARRTLGDFDPGALELRQVRLHARDAWVPLDLVERLPCERESASPTSHAPVGVRSQDRDAPFAWSGLPGLASVAWSGPAARGSQFAAGLGTHALLISHGYCADANTFPVSHFTGDAWWYERVDVNLTNDAFALDLAADGEQFKSYGIVGHSQGGMAAVHLYAFYWSGLDWAGPGRLIQTLGTPFEGTPLAGNIAALGEIFGIQCGANYELTYDGAAAWLSTIPSAVRSRVYTHTTTFNDVPFFYDYCSFASDFFLSDPEDGVVENWSGHIPGANDMGLRSGWCHVRDMRDPDQALDASRNAVMNQEAAR